jgi:hypothetical protein
MGKTISKALNGVHSAGTRHGCVTLSEAARIVKPAVSRAAVFRWIQLRKLKAYRETPNGRYRITLTHLREFAQKYGKQSAFSHTDKD